MIRVYSATESTYIFHSKFLNMTTIFNSLDTAFPNLFIHTSRKRIYFILSFQLLYEGTDTQIKRFPKFALSKGIYCTFLWKCCLVHGENKTMPCSEMSNLFPLMEKGNSKDNEQAGKEKSYHWGTTFLCQGEKQHTEMLKRSIRSMEH